MLFYIYPIVPYALASPFLDQDQLNAEALSPFSKKGRGLDPQDPLPRSCAPDILHFLCATPAYLLSSFTLVAKFIMGLPCYFFVLHSMYLFLIVVGGISALLR